MERATIVGIYDYIGFSLCRYLLEQGVEIDGIHPKWTKENYFTEEKRLEIGRNANFTEIGIQDWNVERAEGFLFVALFETLLTGDDSKLMETLLNKMESRHLKKLPTAVILPAYFARENAEFKKTEAKLREYISSRDSKLLTIYLPTVFGPWQPEECFFQQVMSTSSNGDRKVPDIDTREWTHDCLYIDDTVKMVKEMAESGHRGEYILSSGEQDRWLQCAGELLGKDTVLLRNEGAAPVIKESIQVRTLVQNKQISKGLSRQKEQFNRIQDGRV